MTDKNAKQATEKPAETKAEKFSRLASSRLSKALDAIAAMRGLANRNNYEFTEEQVNKIFGHLEDECKKLHGLFTAPPEAKKEERKIEI